MSDEYPCCYGTPETGHDKTCPFDKLFYGPAGVRIAGYCRNRGIDFHGAGRVMHGENSAYARNLREQAQTRARVEATEVQP
jgi:hypothetical protein